MTRIGLTGGIGSGKSVVAKIFGIMGYPCYDSDSAMKRLYTDDTQLKDDMETAFGHDIYSADGHLDRKRFASILFNDPTAQERLSHIAYPRLAEDYRRWESAQHSSITFFESAILMQVDLPIIMDKVIAVTAPQAMRIERVCKRSGLSADEILSRMAHQSDDDMLMSKASAVFINDSIHPLLPQAERFLQTIHNN